MYDPDSVPERLSKPEVYNAIHALMNQYDMEDFDLGIKQFMIEQAIQQEMEDGLNKGGAWPASLVAVAAATADGLSATAAWGVLLTLRSLCFECMSRNPMQDSSALCLHSCSSSNRAPDVTATTPPCTPGDNKDFEEKLAEQLFADEEQVVKEPIKTADMPDDAFTTEAAEEYLALFGENTALSTAWRVRGRVWLVGHCMCSAATATRTRRMQLL